VISQLNMFNPGYRLFFTNDRTDSNDNKIYLESYKYEETLKRVRKNPYLEGANAYVCISGVVRIVREVKDRTGTILKGVNNLELISISEMGLVSITAALMIPFNLDFVRRPEPLQEA
jgi:hypothetical protein